VYEELHKSNKFVKKIDKTKEVAVAEFLQNLPSLTDVIISLYCPIFGGMSSAFIL
jgi:hypothetical protein